MQKRENYYQRLKFKCDKYGLPIENISDIVIQKAYFECLQEFYIALQQESIRKHRDNDDRRTHEEEEQEKRLKMIKMKQDEADLERRLEFIDDNDLQLKIYYLESMIQGNRYLYIRQKIQDFYNYIKEAYQAIDTERKRMEYNKYISERTEKQWIEALEDYEVPVNYTQLDTDNILYGDLISKNNPTKAVYLSKNLRLFIEEEYESFMAIQGDQASPTKTWAKSVGKAEQIRYSVLIRKGKEGNQWNSKEFYSGRDIATKLMIPYRKSSEPQVLYKKKQELLKGILTVLQESIKNKEKYLGEIVLTEDGIVCLQDEKMRRRVHELDERRKTNGKQAEEGPKIEKFMGGR